MVAARGRPVRQRDRRLALLGVGSVLVLWTLVAGIRAFRATQLLRRGTTEVELARARLKPHDLETASAAPSIAAAGRHFRRADDLLGGGVMMPLRYLPVLGRQLRSAEALAAAASKVAFIGNRALTDASAALAVPRSDSAARLALARRIADVSESSAAKLDAIQLGPARGLVSPLARKRNAFETQLNELRTTLHRGAAAARGAGSLLAGPNDYLLLTGNNAEMRSGSGMFLDVAPVHLANGQITVGAIEKTGNLVLPGAGVPVNGDLEARWGWLHPGREWRNLNLSPGFEASAETATRMWAALGRAPVTGVIALDVETVRRILEIIGPVPGPDGVLTADNVEQFLLHDQYLVGDPYSQERTDRLGTVAGAVLAAIEGPGVDVVRLGMGLARAAAGRHILLWSSDRDLQTNWAGAGLSGALGPDDLLVSLLNTGANKLDYFVTVKPVLELRTVGHFTEASVRVAIKNNTPTGEPPYIAGGGEGLPAGQYRGLLAVNVPGNAGRISIDSASDYAAAGRDGPTIVAAVPVTIDRDTSKELVVRFELAGAHGSMQVVPSARLPAESWQAPGIDFLDTSAHTVRW